MRQPRDKSERETHRVSYELETPVMARPDLPGEVVVTPTADELIDVVAADLVLHAENCVREFGDFQLALPGDPSCELLYRRLMYDPDYRRLPWRRTHLWVVDDRCVPPDDERCGARLIRETIADHADLPPEQFHPIPGASARADTAYQEEIREVLTWREKGQDRLDYVLLAVDPHGATAGLRPGSPALREGRHLVCRCAAIDPATEDRVTMTLSFINASRFVAVLIVGDEGAATVQRLVRREQTVDELPVRGVAPIQGELKWYIDHSACSG